MTARAEREDDFARQLPDVASITYDGYASVAHGLRNGALFVRAAFEDECADAVDRGVLVDVKRMWIVDVPHLRGTMLIATRTFASALIIADDVSRFAPYDLFAARSSRELVVSLGPELAAWLRYLCAMHPPSDVETVPSFREWCGYASRRQAR